MNNILFNNRRTIYHSVTSKQYIRSQMRLSGISCIQSFEKYKEGVGGLSLGHSYLYLGHSDTLRPALEMVSMVQIEP